MGEGKEGKEDCYFEREGKASSAAESKCADDGSDLHERFQVVENENRRKGEISHFPKEVAQLVKDIFGYFEATKGIVLEDRAPSSDIDALSPCPDILSQLYESHDGGWYVYDYRVLSASEVAKRRKVQQIKYRLLKM